MSLSKLITAGLSMFGASPIVGAPSVYAPSRRVGPKPEGGAGVARAAARLKAKHKANKAIPSADSGSRQRRRAAQRAYVKKYRITPAEFARRKMDIINKGG